MNWLLVHSYFHHDEGRLALERGTLCLDMAGWSKGDATGFVINAEAAATEHVQADHGIDANSQLPFQHRHILNVHAHGRAAHRSNADARNHDREACDLAADDGQDTFTSRKVKL